MYAITFGGWGANVLQFLCPAGARCSTTSSRRWTRHRRRSNCVAARRRRPPPRRACLTTAPSWRRSRTSSTSADPSRTRTASWCSARRCRSAAATTRRSSCRSLWPRPAPCETSRRPRRRSVACYLQSLQDSGGPVSFHVAPSGVLRFSTWTCGFS